MDLKDVEFTESTLVEEQETTINHLKEDDCWYIYTCEKSFLTRLKKILTNKDDYEIIKVTPRSVQLKVYSQLLISLRKKINISDEDRQSRRERLTALKNPKNL